MNIKQDRKQGRYIGVTGFMTHYETSTAERALDEDASRYVLPTDTWSSKTLLMVGVLVSSKTLRGIANKHPLRYPRMDAIHSIWSRRPRALNTIHFCSDMHTTTLRLDLNDCVFIGGDYLDAIQINVQWPNPSHLSCDASLRNVRRVILQIGSRAMGRLFPREIAKRVADYKGVITDILIDGSGGRGVPLNPTECLPILDAIATLCPWVGLGVAGGLCDETVDTVAPLLEKHPALNIDAEGMLRTQSDNMDLDAMQRYLRRALALDAK